MRGEDDYLIRLAQGGVGARVLKALGLPAPVALVRGGTGATTPLAGKRFLCAALAGGFAYAVAEATLAALGAATYQQAPPDDAPIDGVVVDATGCRTVGDLRGLYDAFHPLLTRLARGGRIVVVAGQPAEQGDPLAAATARGIEGFVRALAKESGKRGVTANLIQAARGVPAALEGPLRFFCSGSSAYVTGQVLAVSARVSAPMSLPPAARLTGKVAVVTGAARGIGAAIAARLAAEGATVVCLDVPPAQAPLAGVAGRIGGVPLALDITGDPVQLADFLAGRFGGVDIVVHNAGITRDKTLANMAPEAWDQVLAVNLSAIAAADAALDARGLLRDGGRVVCLSSIAGIAGNYGQTNYALSKAALIGYTAARAPVLAERGITINAVAPGFIETPMTRKMPLLTREVARRLNSLAQGGLPEDVAEAVCFLASPDAYGVTGQTLRVCGQSLLGA
jgi:3-oxoacyl-[acyl-carrier protein] reductase